MQEVDVHFPYQFSNSMFYSSIHSLFISSIHCSGWQKEVLAKLSHLLEKGTEYLGDLSDVQVDSVHQGYYGGSIFSQLHQYIMYQYIYHTSLHHISVHPSYISAYMLHQYILHHCTHLACDPISLFPSSF